jgi:cell wall-associated NlpC family hydrolase
MGLLKDCKRGDNQMAGRHAFTPAVAKNAITSPAGRGMAAAAVVGTMFGVALPAANADTLPSDGTDATTAANTATDAVTAPSDASWDVTQVTLDTQTEAEDAVALDVAVTVPDTAEPETQVTTTDEGTTADVTTAAETDTAGTTTAATSAATTSTETTSTTTYSGSSSAAASVALSYVGAPYMYGGVTPSGWDCIGFVRYVYAQLGVSIGGYPLSVLSVGRQVPYSEAQAGDILYWPGHVAISVGGGQNVAAWNPSMGTTVGPDSWVGGTPIVIRVFG